MRSVRTLVRAHSSFVRPLVSFGRHRVASFHKHTLARYSDLVSSRARSRRHTGESHGAWRFFTGALVVAGATTAALADGEDEDVIDTQEGLEAYLAARGVTLAEFLELEAEEDAAQAALASAPGSEALASVLSSPDRDPDAPVTFFDAIEAGSVALVDYLIAHGADPNALEPTEPTPLEAAVGAGRADIALRLLHHGADARRASGMAPLPICVAATLQPDASPRNAQLLQALLSAGADPNAPGPGGIRALHAAIQRLCPSHAAALIAAGADANAPTASGDSPLVLAVRLGDTETVGRLLAVEGIAIDNPSSDDFTPLCAALVNGSESTAVALIEAGADLHRVNRHGASPALAAAATDSAAALAAMVSSGRLGPDAAAGADSKPLLQLAIEFRAPRAAWALLRAGADAQRPWQRSDADAAAATTPAPSIAAVASRTPLLGALLAAPAEVLAQLPEPPRRGAGQEAEERYLRILSEAVAASAATTAAAADLTAGAGAGGAAVEAVVPTTAAVSVSEA